MKQVIMQGPGEPLVISEGRIPEPGKGQLLLRVKACGICGSDLHWAQLGMSEPGTVMGHEFSGEVVKVGAGGEADWKPGDRVTAFPARTCGECTACKVGDLKGCREMKPLGLGHPDADGAYAEYVIVDTAASVKIPDTVSWEEAACIDPFSVGLFAVRRANIRPGENVLVIGAGPIGLAVTSWSKFCGADNVIVSERSAGRMELAPAMGADAWIDANVEKDLQAAFFRKAGAGPNVIVEAAGAPGMIQHCIETAYPRTRIVVVGACIGEDTLQPAEALVKDLELIFSFGYELADFKFALEMTGKGRVKPGLMITHRVSFDGLPAAFEALKTPTTECKVMLLT